MKQKNIRDNSIKFDMNNGRDFYSCNKKDKSLEPMCEGARAGFGYIRFVTCSPFLIMGP